MYRIIILFCIFLFGGCVSTFTDPFAYLDDPVARASGIRWSWEPNKHFDAGIILLRERSSNSAADHGSTNIHAAFDINNKPVKVDGVEVNGLLLPFIEKEQALFHAQIFAKNNTLEGFGEADSATFSYTGFDGEDFTATVEVAPDFGDIISPDTIIVSQGLTIRYGKSVPGDSIHVSIFEQFKNPSQGNNLPVDSIDFNGMLPDTGAIVISPSALPHVQGVDFYVIQVSRFHFTERVSPKGKIIGIYSEEDFPNFIYPAKP